MLLAQINFKGKFVFCYDKGCFSAQINFRGYLFSVMIKDAFVNR